MMQDSTTHRTNQARPSRRCRTVPLLAALIASALAAPVCTAAIRNVGSGQTYATIAAAMAAAKAGDIINVVDPVHTEYGVLVNKSVTIQGQGAASTTVQASATPGSAPDRVFRIASTATVTIRRMTIRHGFVSGSLPERGGGIFSEGNLTLERVTVTANQVVASNPSSVRAGGGGVGGGIELTIRDSTISDNSVDVAGGLEITAGGGGIRAAALTTLTRVVVTGNQAASPYQAEGGGIRADHLLTIRDSSIEGNLVQTMDPAPNPAYGGGIFGPTGAVWDLLEVVDSTVSNNAAVGGDGAGRARGGGIAAVAGLDLVILRSTISNNMTLGGTGAGTAGGAAVGGGVYSSDSRGDVIMENCTVSGNSATGGGGTSGPGFAMCGGLCIEEGLLAYCTVASNTVSGETPMAGGLGLYAPAQIMSSVFADNSGPTQARGRDIHGTFESLDYNLIEQPGGHTATGATEHNIIGEDPNLGPLSYNGGPTATHALQWPSPAINAIPQEVNECVPGFCTDQRGCMRAGGQGWGGLACDMGAYEYSSRAILFADRFETGNTSAWSATVQ